MSIRSSWHGLRVKAANWVGGHAIRAHYSGASTSRLFFDWGAALLSPDQEMYGNSPLLRARARELARNNSYISGFVESAQENTIGHEGIQLEAKIGAQSGKLNQKVNWSIENGWGEWGCPENASIDGRTSWVDQQNQIVRALKVDGEIFVMRRRGADNPFRYALQLVDADFVDDGFNQPAANGANEIRMGVEVDADNRPIAYHTWRVHPSEHSRRGLPRERVRITADKMLHLYRPLRPGQTRGIPELAPIMADMHMLQRYEEAELVAARMQAAAFGAIVQKNPEFAANYTPPKAGEEQVIEAAPGLFHRLAPGEEVQMQQPTHPSDAFAPFVSSFLQRIARGLNISYLTLTGDLAKANYSSMRAGLLPERDHWRVQQMWLVMHCHRVIYRDWIEQALLANMVQVDRRIATEYHAVLWKPRGWKWVDPSNDLKALEAEIKLGINSRQRACGERGVDYEDVIDELKYEQDYAETEGVEIQGEQKPEPAPTQFGKPQGKPAEDDVDARAVYIAPVAPMSDVQPVNITVNGGPDWPTVRHRIEVVRDPVTRKVVATRKHFEDGVSIEMPVERDESGEITSLAPPKWLKPEAVA